MLDIEKNHGKRFIVATTEEQPENVIGTIVYVESKNEEKFKVCFDNLNKLDKKICSGKKTGRKNVDHVFTCCVPKSQKKRNRQSFAQ